MDSSNVYRWESPLGLFGNKKCSAKCAVSDHFVHMQSIIQAFTLH